MQHVGNTVGWTSSANGGKIPNIDITKTWTVRLTCNNGSTSATKEGIIYIFINNVPVAPVNNVSSSDGLNTTVPNIFSVTTTVTNNSWDSHEFEIPPDILNESDNTIVINNTWGYSRIANLILFVKDE